ncbi:uncharacterized protein [Aristolochia californica]|uniref:uncharacterized protein n=1 Tax=Aristolochia californica TaxID=171875 RepID=UPI0035E34503
MGPHTPGHNRVPRYAKLDFPTYDGSTDPLIWLHRCDQFFYNQRTHNEDHFHLAAFHMLDEALLWYHQINSEHHVLDWYLCKEYCILRFGPPARSNPLGDMVNFKQTGTIESYQKQFQERLACASRFVSPSQYVNLFTVGLMEALRLEVELHDPQDLVHAMNLARTIGAKQRVRKESLGHQCKRLFRYDPPLEDSVEAEQDEPVISVHAMIGMHISNTMKVYAGL